MGVIYRINYNLMLKMQNALNKSVEEIRNEAGKKLLDISQDECPVDTGRLRDSKKLTFPAKNKATVTYDPTDPRTGVHYAGYVEIRNPFLQRATVQTKEFLRKHGKVILSGEIRREII